MKYEFDWSFFSESIGGPETYLTWLMSAWKWTLLVSFLAYLIALSIGIAVGVSRTVGNRYVRLLGEIWTESFRNVPILVQIFFWYFVIPRFIPITQELPPFMLAVMALGLYTSARIAEHVKSGILTIPTGQRYAGMAMGLTQPQIYRYVLLPVALRTVIPTLTTEAMSIIKNSSVAFAIGIAELTMYAMQVQEETSRGIEVYMVVTALYFASAVLVNILALGLERFVAVPGFSGGGKKT